MYCYFHKRDNRLKYYAAYKKMQWNSLEENKKKQTKRLYALLKYASENIPYYKKIVEKKSITFSEETIFEDIKKLPILTKDIIRKEFESLYRIQPKISWYYNTSGGSTGEPTKLIQDNNYKAESSAMKRLYDSWAGYFLGETQIKLWGSEKDILLGKDQLKNRVVNWIKSIYLLNTFSMDEERMQKYILVINKKKPKFILAYVQSIYELARFIDKNNYRVYSPKAIMTSAGTLYPSMRETIERIFQCPVFNRYGSREVGDVACECEKHEGLHVGMFAHYVEILDEDLKPCSEGKIGNIYVTLLTNFTMPLIRYKIGDLAVYTKEKCSCGRGLSLIKKVVGRTNSMIRTNKGVIDSVAVSVLLYFFDDGIPFQSFSKYQIIQENKTKIIFKAVISNPDLWLREKKKIMEKFKKVLGSDLKIAFQEVNHILPLKSGKYVYIINKMKNE